MENRTKNQQAILNVIFERAIELEEKAIEFFNLTNRKNIDYAAIRESALKKAFQEWQENKQVFTAPNL